MEMFSDYEFERSKERTPLKSQKKPNRREFAKSPFDEDDVLVAPKRRPVGRPEDIAFEVPVDRKIKKAPAKVNYNARKAGQANRISKKKKGITFIKVGWAIIALLLVRLIFVERGIIDYVSKNESITEKKLLIEKLRSEKTQLEENIIKIRKDKNFQKSLLRDHLGVISRDEYLILFAQERDGKSN
jgi:cell division protein FtsB